MRICTWCVFRCADLLSKSVCVASAFRIYYFHTTHTSASEDFTCTPPCLRLRVLIGDPADLILEDDTYDIFIWTVIEPCMGVVCACLPTLGPLFQGSHSVESFIGSIRSYLGIDSQSQTSKSNVNHRQMSDDGIVLTSIHARDLDDAESHNFAEEGIYVHTKMSKSETERHTSQV